MTSPTRDLLSKFNVEYISWVYIFLKPHPLKSFPRPVRAVSGLCTYFARARHNRFPSSGPDLADILNQLSSIEAATQTETSSQHFHCWLSGSHSAGEIETWLPSQEF